MKSNGHLGRSHLKGREGDAINVILTAVGHNLRHVLAWLRDLPASILVTLWWAGVRHSDVKQLLNVQRDWSWTTPKIAAGRPHVLWSAFQIIESRVSKNTV